MEVIMAEKKTQTDKYTKEAILKSEKLRWNRDVLSVLLESGKEYTLDDVEMIVNEFNKREVK